MPEAASIYNDFDVVHFKPAKLAMVCGAGWRVMNDKSQPSGTLLKLKGTTNLDLVTCPHCKDKIRLTVSRW